MATTEILEQLIKDPDKLKNLVDEVKDLAFLYGIVFRTHEKPNSSEVGATTKIYHCSFKTFKTYILVIWQTHLCKTTYK